jgi:hypothetical protein
MDRKEAHEAKVHLMNAGRVMNDLKAHEGFVHLLKRMDEIIKAGEKDLESSTFS